jgi:serine/threonine protein kinase
MIVYTLKGDYNTHPETLYEGKDFFRKMTERATEIKICEILMKRQHNNIVKIYRMGEDYVDMELLNTDMRKENMNKLKNIMMEVKTYLQNLGIMYIDWKLDNIGITDDKQIRIFDFDASGLIDVETKQWIRRPAFYWSHMQAIKNGIENPIDIDNYAFDIEFNHKKYN